MSLIVTLIVGGLAGWLASIIVGKNADMGILANIVVGIIGAFIGNWVFSGVTGTVVDLSSPTWGGFALAVLGSVVLLFVINLIAGRFKR